MEKLEQQLLEFLSEVVRTVSLEQLNQEFGNENEKDDILTAIANLERKGKIFRNKRN